MSCQGSTNQRRSNLTAVAERQQGYFTASQAEQIGYSNKHHRYHLDRNNWQKIAFGLYRLPGYADTMEAEFAKWCLWSRNQKDQPQAVISHQSALAYFGLAEFDPQQIHLTVPVRFQKTVPEAVVIHRASLNLSDIEPKESFLVTRLPKTLTDLQPVLTEQHLWPKTVAQAYAAGRLTPEEYRQLGFCAEVTVPLGGAPQATAEPGSGAVRLMQPEPANAPAPLEGSELMRERIYQMIFQRTQDNSRRRAQAGFTLVELLVVITIISVLAALLLPVLEKAVSVAHKACCANNERQIGLALQNYTSDFGDYLPLVVGWSSGVWPYDWHRALAPFIDSTATPDTAGVNKIYRVLQCPPHTEAFVKLAGTEARRKNPNYGMNHTFGPNGQRIIWRRIGRFARPSGTLAVTAGGYFPVYNPQQQLDGYYLSKGVEMHNGVGVHSNGNNILWLDGHVAWWIDVTRLTQAPYSIGSAENAWCQGFDYTQP